MHNPVEALLEVDGPAYASSATPARVLVVDDEEGIRAFFLRLLGNEGYTVDVASDGAAALTAVAEHPPDVVLLDLVLPGLDGFEVCRQLKRNIATRLTPVILVTGQYAREQRVAGLAAGADDFLTKPVDTQELLARVRSLVRMKRYTDDLDSAAAIIMTLATMIEARDGHSAGHCSRMANYATSLGRALKLSDVDLQTLYRGGFLHDIGMLAIPDHVLQKAGPLDSEEYQLVKSHTVVGDTLCSHLRSLQSVRPIIRHHHELLDGSGYPDGLHGDEIPLLAQIMGVIDVYEAVTTQRPYQGAKPVNEAIEVLRAQAENGRRHHSLVEEFVGLVQQGALQTFPTDRPDK